MPDLLSLTHVSKSRRDQPVVHDISFTLPRFRKLAIAGVTGSGKSTVLKMIGGLEQPDAGTILFEGKKVKGPLEVLIPGTPGTAYLSQHFELRNHYRMEELLDMANRLTGAEAAAIVELCRVGHLMKRKSDQLSGGEKQRIALACCLVTGPSLLLLDEPFSNMDAIHRSMLKSVIEEVGAQLGTTMILVSHDPADILSWADEIIVMQEGRIVQQGAPAQLYHRPQSEYVAGLLGSYNLLPAGYAPGLAKLAGIPARGRKKLFIRPEDLSPVPEAEQADFTGWIEQVYYFGSHYELAVRTGNARLLVRLQDTDDAQTGTKIHLSARPGSVGSL